MSAIDPQTRQNSAFSRLFLSHPASVNEGYFQHMGFALRFAGLLGLAAGAALVHALIPALCQTTASRIVQRLHARLSARHNA
jgi:hypothetical protein